MKTVIFIFVFFFSFSLFAQNVGIGTTSPKEQLHNTGTYYGLGDIRLHAIEGDGNTGTAFIQGMDDSGFSHIGLQFRTQNGGNIMDALHLQSTGNAVFGDFGGTSFAALAVNNSSPSNTTIFNVMSSDQTPVFQVLDNGRAGINHVYTSVGLNVRNAPNIPTIFNAESEDGTTRFNVQATGRVGIGTDTPKEQLHNTGDYYGRGHFWLHAFEGDGSSGTAYLQARDDGGSSINLRLRTQLNGNVVEALAMDPHGNIYAPHISSGDHSNMQYRTSDGAFFYDNSSRRYKRNIQPLEDDFSLILKAQPKTYTRPDYPERWEVGYIAEEMDSLGLTKLVSYDEEGIPDGFNYEKMILYVNEILKMHHADLESKEQEIAGLEQSTGQIHIQLQQQQLAIEALQAAVFTSHVNNSSNDSPERK